MDLDLQRPGDLVSANQEKTCPSAGNHLSTHRENPVSAVTRAAIGAPACRRRLAPADFGERVASPLDGGREPGAVHRQQGVARCPVAKSSRRARSREISNS